MTLGQDQEIRSAGSSRPTSSDHVSYSREGRNKCWKAKERYFECLDKNGDAQCGKEYEDFSKLCPEVWVSYFISKRNYIIKMEEAKKQLEEEISQSVN